LKDVQLSKDDHDFMILKDAHKCVCLICIACLEKKKSEFSLKISKNAYLSGLISNSPITL